MKFLLAVDGSEHALKAAKAASRLLKDCGGEVILISVVQDIAPMGIWEMGHQEKVLKSLHARAREAVEEAKNLLKAEGVSIRTTLISTGEPADEIIRMAKKETVDMIVIGSRGLTGLPQYLLGSVAHKIVTHAHCSVLVIK